MTPEELAEARHYATCYQAGYVHDLMHNFLAHIDQQAVRIAVLEAQVAALKKIAIKGIAQMLIADGAEMCIVPDSVYSEADCYCVEDVMQCPARDYVLSEARRQLQAEHPEAFR